MYNWMEDMMLEYKNIIFIGGGLILAGILILCTTKFSLIRENDEMNFHVFTNRTKLEKYVSDWENENNSKLIFLTPKHKSRDNHVEDYINSFHKQMVEIDDNKNVDIILHTNGGETMSCKMISDLILNHEGKVRIYVPFRAYSSGTTIALSSTELYLGKKAFLSPADIQMYVNKQNGYMPSKLFKRYNKEISIMSNTDMLLHVGEGNDTVNAMEKMFQKIINKRYQDVGNEVILKIKQNIIEQTVFHEYPYDYNECVEMGIKITGECPKRIYEICKERFVIA
jgi:ClpP class serine protease